MENSLLNIDNKWMDILDMELSKPYFVKLIDYLEKEYSKETIYPKKELIFNAFNETSFEDLKVVILGQDPYHGENQAHGLSFSVPKGIKLPPSLKNIFKELDNDLGIKLPTNGDLTSWANQGVLLLNSILTVKKSEAGSHQKKGWETFTDSCIKLISDKKEGVVFILWGNYAKQKASLIDNGKHLILTAAHPSPFSAYNGFYGCKHFSKTNEWLIQKGYKEIDWVI